VFNTIVVNSVQHDSGMSQLSSQTLTGPLSLLFSTSGLLSYLLSLFHLNMNLHMY
jgi:predicted benzoate:H+ symporter BenE